MDDTSKAVAINLRRCVEKSESQTYPVPYHNRTGHRLKEDHNPLQVALNDFVTFTKKNEFGINVSKSSVMIFNFARQINFFPSYFVNEVELEVVHTSKTLGMILSADLKWNSHIEYICLKASARIWSLRRMLELDIDIEVILDIHYKEIPTIIEYPVVLYHTGV